MRCMRFSGTSVMKPLRAKSSSPCSAKLGLTSSGRRMTPTSNGTSCLMPRRDLCVGTLLRWARDDLSTGKQESRAASLLLQYFEPHIKIRVRAHISNVCDVDDVVNRVRTKLWRCLLSFDGERRQLYSYINKACSSACTDWWRGIPNQRTSGTGRVPIHFEPLLPQYERPGSDDDDNPELRDVEMRVFIQRAVRQLCPKNKRPYRPSSISTAGSRRSGPWAFPARRWPAGSNPPVGGSLRFQDFDDHRSRRVLGGGRQQAAHAGSDRSRASLPAVPKPAMGVGGPSTGPCDTRAARTTRPGRRGSARPRRSLSFADRQAAPQARADGAG